MKKILLWTGGLVAILAVGYAAGPDASDATLNPTLLLTHHPEYSTVFLIPRPASAYLVDIAGTCSQIIDY